MRLITLFFKIHTQESKIGIKDNNSSITKSGNRSYPASNFPELPSSHGKEEKNVKECVVQLLTQGKRGSSSGVASFHVNLSYESLYERF